MHFEKCFALQYIGPGIQVRRECQESSVTAPFVKSLYFLFTNLHLHVDGSNNRSFSSIFLNCKLSVTSCCLLPFFSIV